MINRITEIWHNGRFLPAAEFQISPSDRGLTLGLGFFETLLAHDGQAVFLEQHLTRLANGFDRLGWQPPSFEFAAIAAELLKRNGLEQGRAKIRLTMTASGDACVWLTVSRFDPTQGGIAVNFAAFPKNENSPLAGLKCTSYAENILALDRACALGFGETLFFNQRQQLCEAAMANVFLLQNGRLRTPSLASGCLPGITRALVLKLAQQLPLRVEEAELSRADLDSADEIFLTSSLRGLSWVSQLDGKHYPQPTLTPQLQQLWNEQVATATMNGFV
jgi:branched-chain amino acid aminotransferase